MLNVQWEKREAEQVAELCILSGASFDPGAFTLVFQLLGVKMDIQSLFWGNLEF